VHTSNTLTNAVQSTRGALKYTCAGLTIARYSELARELNVWLSLGKCCWVALRTHYSAPAPHTQEDSRCALCSAVYNCRVYRAAIKESLGDHASHIGNAHVLISDRGETAATYRKIHLFDAPTVNLHESAFTRAGSELVCADSPVGSLGLTVCYDLRFSELYLALRAHGAQVLLVPSAFTTRTGQAHWYDIMERMRTCLSISNMHVSAGA
jgi:predicted amidohydrolase